MAEERQSHGALRAHFGEQLTFLTLSGRAYDAGTHIEAKRIAAIMRVLLHHTPKSHALLVQLGWRDQWTWADTAGVLDERGLLPISNLAPFAVSAEMMEFRPKLDRWNARSPEMLSNLRSQGLTFPREPGYFITFAEWWTMPVIRDSDGKTFSRRDLVLNISNHDGGAHVDPAVPVDWYRLSRSQTFGWKVYDGDGNVIENARVSPVLPSLRQIAHELTLTLRRHWVHPDKDPKLSHN